MITFKICCVICIKSEQSVIAIDYAPSFLPWHNFPGAPENNWC